MRRIVESTFSGATALRRQKPVRPMAHHRQQHHQATSERQIAVALMGHKSRPPACRRTDRQLMAERENGDPERGKQHSRPEIPGQQHP